MQINLCETFEDVPEDTPVFQSLELIGEQELVEEDVADVTGKLGDVINQVLV